MTARDLIRAGTPLPCQPWPRMLLSAEAWASLAAALPGQPAVELLALWADTQQVHALLRDGADILPCSVGVVGGHYPALSPARPAAAWFERMIRDLWGHSASGGTDARPWLDHGRWGVTAPLATRPTPCPGAPPPMEFLPVEADDFHQLPVGPVHAGIIEPGHFRFSAVGETVLRLELRLGFLHKGTLGLMRGKSPRAAARFAARLSGDSTVAHGIAFARAAEAASGVAAPDRAAGLRAVMGEVERIANHLGDCGAIIGDAGIAWLPTRFGWHREAMLAAAQRAFGHRLMMDCVIPGGVAADIAPDGAAAILAALAALAAEFPALVAAYEGQPGLVDRVIGTGRVTPEDAQRFAAGGFVGRASGRDFDTRTLPGYPPHIPHSRPVRAAGDVDARVRVRLAEIAASSDLLRDLLAALPDGDLAVVLPMTSGEGIGWAEGFRGDVWHWLRLDGGLIGACFLRDPSWLQWPLLETAVLGNIVADFPLINKSFNCSYSGVDL